MTVLAQIQGEHNVKCTPVLWEWLKKVMCLIDKQHSNFYHVFLLDFSEHAEPVVRSDDAAAPDVPGGIVTNHRTLEEGVDPLPTGGSKAVNGQSVRATGRRGGRRKRITFTRELSSTEEESDSEKYVSSFLSVASYGHFTIWPAYPELPVVCGWQQ